MEKIYEISFASREWIDRFNVFKIPMALEALQRTETTHVVVALIGSKHLIVTHRKNRVFADTKQVLE